LKPLQWTVTRLVRASGHDLELSERLIVSVLQDLQGVQIRLYEVEKNRSVFDQAIDDSVITLKKANWQTLLSARDGDKRIVVMQAGDNELISGMSILVSTPENAAFVNLVGELTPESIEIIAKSLAAS